MHEKWILGDLKNLKNNDWVPTNLIFIYEIILKWYKQQFDNSNKIWWQRITGVSVLYSNSNFVL